MKILITGGSGKLGKALKKIFPNALTPTRQKLDLTSSTSINSYFYGNPGITHVINTAALTGIKQCEENKDIAIKTNVGGVEKLSNAIKNDCHDATLIQISTACIFSGEDKGTYTEEDYPYPKNFYALSKLLGELVLKYNTSINYHILRTNFVEKGKWMYPKAFTDRKGTYLYADDVAMAIKEFIEEQFKENPMHAHKINHICGDKEYSMYDLAKLSDPEVKPMTLSEYKGTPLTKNMSLTTINWKNYELGFAGK